MVPFAIELLGALLLELLEGGDCQHFVVLYEVLRRSTGGISPVQNTGPASGSGQNAGTGGGSGQQPTGTIPAPPVSLLDRAMASAGISPTRLREGNRCAPTTLFALIIIYTFDPIERR